MIFKSLTCSALLDLEQNRGLTLPELSEVEQNLELFKLYNTFQDVFRRYFHLLLVTILYRNLERHLCTGKTLKSLTRRVLLQKLRLLEKGHRS